MVSNGGPIKSWGKDSQIFGGIMITSDFGHVSLEEDIMVGEFSSQKIYSNLVYIP
jgi:hypothetical protein